MPTAEELCPWTEAPVEPVGLSKKEQKKKLEAENFRQMAESCLASIQDLIDGADTLGSPLNPDTPFEDMREIKALVHRISLTSLRSEFATSMSNPFAQTEYDTEISREEIFREVLSSSAAKGIERKAEELLFKKMKTLEVRKMLHASNLGTFPHADHPAEGILKRIHTQQSEAGFTQPPALVYHPEPIGAPWYDAAWRVARDNEFLRLPQSVIAFCKTAEILDVAILNTWDDREAEAVVAIFDKSGESSSLQEIVAVAAALDAE